MTDTANELIAQARTYTRRSGAHRIELLHALADALEAAQAERDEANGNLENAIAAFNASCGETDKYEAERDTLLALARNVTRAFTAESEDWNDGEYTLWKKDDLIAALVALRVAVPPGPRRSRG